MAFRSTLIFLFLFSVHASACTPSGKRLASCVCLWLMLPHVDAPHVLPSRPRLSLSGRSQASRTRALGPGRPWGPCAAARRAAGLMNMIDMGVCVYVKRLSTKSWSKHLAVVDGSRSRIVAGSSRTNRLAAMPPFLALCGGVVGGVVQNEPDISTHISISAAHSVSSHTDRASRSTADHARILTADYGGDMTDKSLLAVEDLPAVDAVGFGSLELGFVVGLDIFVAELLAPAAVGGEGAAAVGTGTAEGRLVGRGRPLVVNFLSFAKYSATAFEGRWIGRRTRSSASVGGRLSRMSGAVLRHVDVVEKLVVGVGVGRAWHGRGERELPARC
eukprot:scaffold6068_cov119-Isochrysis_galbana.AAC.22